MNNNIIFEDVLPQYNGEKINAPGENPYELLKGYIDPNNKVQFKITYKGRTVKGTSGNKTLTSVKLTDAQFGNNGYITLIGKSQKGNVEATILQQQFLGVMTGAMAPLNRLRINGNEIARTVDKQYIPDGKEENDTQERNYYILLQQFADGKLRGAQKNLLTQVLEIYNNLPQNSKNFIIDKVRRFQKLEEDLIKSGKKGKPEDYTSVEKLLGYLPNMKLYSVGNSKVSRDTLLVNITSASDCPSFKIHQDDPEHGTEPTTCLAGSACYAIASESQYYSTKRRNRVLNIINLICLTGNRMDLIKNIISEYIDSARQAGFNIRNIRLNENGDFIGQNCINQYSKICGELRDEMGVITTAYTAKTKNYFGDALDYTATHNNDGTPGTPPNIVLTVSRADKKSITPAKFVKNGKDFEGEVEKTAIGQADRFFLAIPEELFVKLPDTPVLEKGMPNLASNPAFSTPINPKGLFHKCQCEIDKGKVCGDCQVCYTPNTSGVKYFIFCKLHGPVAKNFKEEFANLNRGFDKDITQNFNPDKTNAPQEAQPYTKDVDDRLRQQANYNTNNSNNWFQNRQQTPRKPVAESLIDKIVRENLKKILK